MAKSAFTNSFLLTMSNHELKVISGSVQPVNNINKDICGAKLLPTVVSAYVRILWIVSVSVAY